MKCFVSDEIREYYCLETTLIGNAVRDKERKQTTCLCGCRDRKVFIDETRYIIYDEQGLVIGYCTEHEVYFSLEKKDVEIVI